MLRVLNVNTSLDAVRGGGGVERTFQITRYLVRAGVRCTVLTTDVGLTEARLRELAGAEVIALPCLVRRLYLPRPSIGRIRDAVARADVVHLMAHWSILNVLTYLVVRCLGKPYVVCPVGTLVIYGRSKLLKRAYNLLFGYRMLRNAAFCVAVTRDEVHTLAQHGVPPERIVVIPNGVPEDDFGDATEPAFRARLGLGASPFILFVGRLNPIKGPDLLVKAFCRGAAQFPDFHLVMAGPDEGMLAELRQLVAESGLEHRVHFVGYLGGAEKSRVYHAASLLVIPSRHEAMSIVALEAGICATPVLITDQCGFNKVTDVSGGRVVAADADAIETALRGMLTDRIALGEMGRRLKAYVRDEFTWQIMIAKYVELYRRCTGNDERRDTDARGPGRREVRA